LFREECGFNPDEIALMAGYATFDRFMECSPQVADVVR